MINNHLLLALGGSSWPSLFYCEFYVKMINNHLLLALGGSSWPSLFYSFNHDFIVVHAKGFQKNLGDRTEIG